eukprot:1178136-Prorocentrum_minimum.AAC.5
MAVWSPTDDRHGCAGKAGRPVKAKDLVDNAEFRRGYSVRVLVELRSLVSMVFMRSVEEREHLLSSRVQGPKTPNDRKKSTDR